MASTNGTTSVTKVTTRSDLSALYKVLRVGMRQVRPHLVGLGGPLPAGSPKLTKRPKSHKGVRIEERRCDLHAPADSDTDTSTDNFLWLYDFIPDGLNVSESLRDAKHVIYYFAGGGFQMGASSEHWKFCSSLTADLHAQALDKAIRICLVSYPLAPNSPAVKTLPMLQRWLSQVIKDATEKGRRITLMGDSAGGNVVLSLGLWWAKQVVHVSNGEATGIDAQQDQEQDRTWVQKAGTEKILGTLFVLSPPCDMRNENPDIDEANKHDPVLRKDLTTNVAKAWTKGMSPSDPTVSPNLADLSPLKRSGIKVHGTIGTHDCLAPDALIFKDLCEKNEIPGEWLIWEGQMHCFPLAACYGLSEGKEGVQWVERVLKQYS